MRDLTARYAPEKVAISFPSLRIGSLSNELVTLIKEVRKTGITVAPEAGSVRLRRVINKDVEEDEILRTARLVFDQGWLSLKLYFMIGLPTETNDDLQGIVDLCDRILADVRSGRARKKLIVSLSTFVPKPHTPFQWIGQLSLAETKARLGWVRRELRKRGIQVKWQDPHLSLLEGAFSRGDRRLSRVLSRAHELGCRFDGWSDQFRFERWERAFKERGIPLEEYVTMTRSLDEVLPWNHIDTGVSREYLLKEFQRAMAGKRTTDCKEGQCQGCGVCDQDGISVVLANRETETRPFPGMDRFQGLYHRSRGREVRRKFRVRYAKCGSARFISHLELHDAIIRALRRGNIPLQFSEGHHPKARIDFGPALAVGVESLEEYFDFESFGHLRGSEIIQMIKRTFPEGIEPMACDEIPLETCSLFRIPNRTHYVIRIPQGKDPTGKALEERIDRFTRMPSCLMRRVRKNKVQEVDIKNQVLNVELSSPQTLHLQLYTPPDGAVRIMEVVGAVLGLETNEVRKLRILKTNVEFLESSVKDVLRASAQQASD
jgi:radical SAM-linked protein